MKTFIEAALEGLEAGANPRAVLEMVADEQRRACARQVYAMRLDHPGRSPEARLAKRVLAVAAKELSPISPARALDILIKRAQAGDGGAREILGAVHRFAPPTTEKE